MTGEYEELDGTVRLNALKLEWGFDFDRVEIVDATDAGVERFAMAVGNETNEARQESFERMRCVVRPGCQLCENTLRILRSTFGKVRVDPDD